MRRLRHVRDHFHATLEITRPPVRGTDEPFVVPRIHEVEDAGVLEQQPTLAHDADVLRLTGDAGTQEVDTAHHEVHAHACL